MRRGILVAAGLGVAVAAWWAWPASAPAPDEERREPAAPPASRRPGEPVAAASPPGAAEPLPTDRRGRIEALRARGAGVQVKLPGGLPASGAADAAGRTGAEMVDRRAERVVRRAELALDDLRPLVKDEAVLADVEAVLDRLEEDLLAARDGMRGGATDLPSAMAAMDEAQRDAAADVAGLLDGEPAAVMEKVLGPPPPVDGDWWGGTPLEEWKP